MLLAFYISEMCNPRRGFGATESFAPLPRNGIRALVFFSRRPKLLLGTSSKKRRSFGCERHDGCSQDMHYVFVRPFTTSENAIKNKANL